MGISFALESQWNTDRYSSGAAFFARVSGTTCGSLSASGSMLQRRLDLPDATVLVLEGILFMLVLASEALYGRTNLFRPSTP